MLKPAHETSGAFGMYRSEMGCLTGLAGASAALDATQRNITCCERFTPPTADAVSGSPVTDELVRLE